MANENLWFCLVDRGHDKIGQKCWPATEALFLNVILNSLYWQEAYFPILHPLKAPENQKFSLGGWETCARKKCVKQWLFIIYVILIIFKLYIFFIKRKDPF